MSEIDDNSCQSAEEVLEDELHSYCSSTALTNDGIHEIIQRHKFGTQHRGDYQFSHYQFFYAACCNEKVTEEIIQCLLEYFPDAVNDVDDQGQLPLHRVCISNNLSIGIVQLLIDAAPDSVHCVDCAGYMPLHCLCCNRGLDETKALAILRLLLEKCPESIRHEINDGLLPIQIAAIYTKSPEICSVLVDAYPGSERITDDMGMLPFHYACMRNTVDIVKCLYNLYPDAINHATLSGVYPIHVAIAVTTDKIEALKIVKFLLACDPNVKFQEGTSGGENMEPLLPFACRCEYDETNTMAALEIIEVICDAHPEFICAEDDEGQLLLHQLCALPCHNEAITLAIMRLLLKKCPESIRHENNDGLLPIHIAAVYTKSPEICRVLIEAYPGSERIPTISTGMLPFHYACMRNTVDIVEYLYNLYPDAIEHTSAPGVYPIHSAVRSVIDRETNKGAAVDIVKFMLDCDPRVKFQKLGAMIPLFDSVYFQNFNDANISFAMEIIKVIYDAQPEAIESSTIVSTIDGRHPQTCHPQMRAFVVSQRGYSYIANDSILMTTPSANGQLPLHTLLQKNLRLGSIKVLVKGNPLALQSPDNRGTLPLHIACMHHESASVVQYLVGLDATTLGAVDHDNDTVLHYACRGAKYETITLLLEKYDAASVSKRNAEEKLPIEALWESDEVVDRESVEYTESIFRLLRAYPETSMNCM